MYSSVHKELLLNHQRICLGIYADFPIEHSYYLSNSKNILVMLFEVYLIAQLKFDRRLDKR